MIAQLVGLMIVATAGLLAVLLSMSDGPRPVAVRMVLIGIAAVWGAVSAVVAMRVIQLLAG